MFDTTGINMLEDGGSASEPLMRGLECGFEVILTATVADEIIANKDTGRRNALLSRFRRLLRHGKCLWPPNEIIRLLIFAHFRNPTQFNWTAVDVRAQAYEAAIPSLDSDSELYAQQRKELFATEKQFKKISKGLRPQLDQILTKDPSMRPSTYREAAVIAGMDGGVLWSFGRALYEDLAENEPNETEIKKFMHVCPPFRGLCYSLVMAWYDGSLGLQDGRPTAGRNNLLMAAYLPYCDRFVTADWAQRNALREIAVEAKIDCSILSFEGFDHSLTLLN